MSKSHNDQPEISQQLVGHNEAIQSLSFNSNSEQVISCSNDCKLYLWNTKNPKKKPHRLEGHKAAITQVHLRK